MIPYSKVAFAKLCGRKNALTSTDLFNEQVIFFFEQQAVFLLRILTNHGTQCYGLIQYHQFQLYLAIEDIDHSNAKVRSPQSNGICERLHQTKQEEF